MTIRQLLRTVVEDLHHCTGARKFSILFISFFIKKNFRVLLNYRIGRFLFLQNRFGFLRAYLRYRMQTKFNCDISYSAVLGARITFPHPINIVIGEGCRVGDDVYIWQSVTLGSHGKGTLGKTYPVVKNRVKIFTGSTIIGGATIHEDAVVGAMTLVTKDVAEGTTVRGTPAESTRKS